MFGETPVEMGLAGYETHLLVRLARVPQYQKLFAAAFPGEAHPFSLLNITRALASFERSLLSGRAPYDRCRSGAAARLEHVGQEASGRPLVVGNHHAERCPRHA
jgi:cytochrome c peroxidase